MKICLKYSKLVLTKLIGKYPKNSIKYLSQNTINKIKLQITIKNYTSMIIKGFFLYILI